jgi:hypothetical protein
LQNSDIFTSTRLYSPFDHDFWTTQTERITECCRTRLLVFTYRSRTLTFPMRPANSGCAHCWIRPRKGSSFQAYSIVTQCGSSFHAYRTATTSLWSVPCGNTRANPHADYAPIPSCKRFFVWICNLKCSILLGYVINL